MITNQIMLRDFNGSKISQRTSDRFFNATELLAFYNSQGNPTVKRFEDFWRNQNTQQIYKNILIKIGITNLHETSRGRGGATWMHEELLIVFYNWLYRLPNQTITRDEIVFCTYIEEAFKDVLTFERQKLFDIYYVDLYCKELKLCIEFDEEQHNKELNKLSDFERQNLIQNKYGVSFIRHNFKDNYSITINKILKICNNSKI